MKTLLTTTLAAAACTLSLASNASAQSAAVYAAPMTYMAPAPYAAPTSYAMPATYATPAAYAGPTRAERSLARAHTLMVTGGVLFGSMYALNGLIAIDHLLGHDPVQQQIGALELIPAFGPFVAMAALPSTNCSVERLDLPSISCSLSEADRAITITGLAIDGLVQISGLTLLLVGGVLHGQAQHAVNAERRASVHVTPGAPGAPAGLSLSVVHF